MAKRSRPAGDRPHTYRRRGGGVTASPAGAQSSAAPVAPRVTAPAETSTTPVSTKITTTDYGYVVGELRRIALLTALILVLLAVLWAVLG